MSGRAGDDVAARLAMPGDPDLDCDVTGLVITSVVAEDASREILIHASGGTGRWIATTGDDTAVTNISHADFAARLPLMPDGVWAAYVGTLTRWRDEGTPLHMTAAPGRITLLIENRDTFLPFPRRPDPLGHEEDRP